MTTAYDPNANDYNDANDGTYTADDAPAPNSANSSDLAAGTYRARAVQWAWDEDKSGDPCIAFMLELLDGKPGYQVDGRLFLDESKPDAKGRTSLSRSLKTLAAMGLQGQIPNDLSTVDLSTGEVSAVVEINAKGYPFAHYINPPHQDRELRTFATPAPQKVNAFLAKINARLASVGAQQRASGTAPMAAPIVQPAAQQRPVARPQPAAQGRPVGGQNGQTNARAAQPAQRPAPTPPPRMHGNDFGEFASDADDSSIPF